RLRSLRAGVPDQLPDSRTGGVAVQRAGQIYRALFDHGSRADVDLFDLHVAASIVALASGEAEAEGVALSDRTGLDPVELEELCFLLFPDAALPDSRTPDVEPQEKALRDILWMNSARASVYERLL